MKHFGDITKIDGYKVPIVDCVIGGSPCQDLSIAGLRAGLEGARSGLYMEQIRIVKEMREHDKRNGRTGVDVRPRFMVWENVPGAFSSNKGEDFRIVLEELAKITDENASIPMPEKSKWTTSGCIVGDGWSIAWRVLDAQFWGVPQRRRRISLVADFGGESAAEILFVRKSLYGNIEQGKPKRQNSSTDTSKGIGNDDKPYTMIVHNGCEGGGKGALVQTDISATLNTTRDQTLFQPVIYDARGNGDGKTSCNLTSRDEGSLGDYSNVVCYSIENHPADSRVDIDESGKVQTLTTRMGTGGGNVPMVMETFSKTHRASSKDDNETWKESGTANTLNTFDQGGTMATDVVVAFDGCNPNFIDIEMEVAVRKYEVNTNLLCECLRDHKAGTGFSNKEIAERLHRPITEVEHWFRTDKCFAIPDPNIWHDVKKLLGIKTDEFDESITTFVYKGSEYDMRNRIHTGEVSPTLTCGSGNDLHLLPNSVVALDRASYNQGVNAKFDIGIDENGIAHSLVAKGPSAVCYGFDPNATRDVGQYFLENMGNTVVNGSCPGHHNGVCIASVDCRNFTENSDINGTLQAKDSGGTFLNLNNVVRTNYIVRRLTPLECERLQGYPDGWTDIGDWTDSKGKVHKTSDSARYKALGNSIALPPWKWVLKKLCACYERNATMASLFDGIGGFPYLWEQINGKGTCLWASEIEEFPMAVTKKRLGGD